MSSGRALSLALVGLMSLWPLQTQSDAQEKPTVQLPQPGVPEIITMEGKFVRASYNREGYVILGYQASNRSIGEEWMLLEVGMTILDNVPDYRLKREHISLETPDGKTIPLPSITEQRSGNVNAIQQRAKVQRDSINYFPTRASKALRPAVLSRPGIPGASVRRGGSRATTAPVSAASTSRSPAASPTASTGST